MKNHKFILIISILIIIVIAFKFPFLKTSGIGKKINEITEVNHVKEIQEVISKFDSLYNINIEQSGAVGGAVVVTYKGQVALINFRLKFQGSTNSITVRNLLSHTSGLTPHAFDIMVEDKVPLNKIISRLNEVEIVTPPGLYYAYQNVMFSLYDPILKAKTKKGFQEILQENIFEPFGMKNASSDFESFEKNENKAFPHVKSEKGFVAARSNDRYYITAPAAGINASISDMGHFMIAISGKDDDLFSEKAREVVFTPQIESVLKRTYYRNWDKIDSKHYAIGWRILNYKNHKIAHHSGYVLGYQAEIAICEEEEVGIAILSNSPNSSFSAGVPTFLNLFFEHKNKQALEKIIVI